MGFHNSKIEIGIILCFFDPPAPLHIALFWIPPLQLQCTMHTHFESKGFFDVPLSLGMNAFAVLFMKKIADDMA